MKVNTEGANQVRRKTKEMRVTVLNGLAAVLLIIGLVVSSPPNARAGADTLPAVPESGRVSGTTRNALGLAVPSIKVTVHRIEGDVDRTVISGVAGTFGLDDLKPGHYKLMASNEGATSPSAVVEVVAGQSARVDVIAANTAADAGTLSGGSVSLQPLTTAVADPAFTTGGYPSAGGDASSHRAA